MIPWARWRANDLLFITVTLMLTSGVVALPNEAKSEEIGSIAELRWDHRILIGAARDPDPALHAFAARVEGLRDRDLLYFLLSDQARFTNATRAQSEGFWGEAARLVPRDGFALIGRDGGVKARYVTLDLDSVFALIDTMPMRIEEMRTRNSQ